MKIVAGEGKKREILGGPAEGGEGRGGGVLEREKYFPPFG